MHLVEMINPSIQTLLDEDVEFDLGHVQPTAVLGRVDELETIPQRFGGRGRKRLVERARAVSIEIVHHERDLFSPAILPGNGLQKVCPIDLRFAFRDPDDSSAGPVCATTSFRREPFREGEMQATR